VWSGSGIYASEFKVWGSGVVLAVGANAGGAWPSVLWCLLAPHAEQPIVAATSPCPHLNRLEERQQNAWEYMRLCILDVYTDGHFVFGLQSCWERPNGTRLWGMLHLSESPHGQSSRQRAEFENGEKITKVLVRSGAWVDQVYIETSMGRKHKFGGNGGQARVLDIPEGSSARFL